MPKDDPMTLTEIGELCGVDRTVAYRWSKAGHLGDRVEGPGPARYRRSAAVAYGQKAGYLDARGRRVERDPMTRSRVVPQAGRGRLYVPDVAAMFGVREGTVHAWVHRGKLTALPDESGEGFLVFSLPMLRAFAREENKTMDEKAKRPASDA